MPDVLDKIVVPGSAKKAKGDVFRQAKEEKDEAERPERPAPKKEYAPAQRKQIFSKSEFGGQKKEVVLKFSVNPRTVERGIFIAIILVLGYFAFFDDIDFGSFSMLAWETGEENEDSIPVEEATAMIAKEEEAELTLPVENETEEPEKPPLSGKVTATIGNIETQTLDSGIFKVDKFTFTLDNQKEEPVSVDIYYYAYGSGVPGKYRTEARNKGEPVSYGPVGSGEKITETVDTTITFIDNAGKVFKAEFIDKADGAILANITQAIS
ncbi:MAG TPA: hypothetical protein VJC16_07815 [Candidatus Nanoarchaeia archaeon]|nr:hypothetical protein [Candidatus Nanoarchaeia archaeon]